MSNDRIEKHVVLQAPLARVWQALTDHRQFGAWFGVELDMPFVAGQKVTGRLRSPKGGATPAKYDGVPLEWHVETIEPMHRFTFRWHPFAVDPSADYSAEPMTLVAFELEAAGDATRLRITETGFDRIPLDRRAKAFGANDAGWGIQAERIARYLAG